MGKERRLTKDEEKRQAVFEEICGRLEAEGYQRKELTVSGAKANTVGILYGLIVSLPVIVLFSLTVPESGIRVGVSSRMVWPVLMAWTLVLTVIHELIHGMTWSLFTKDHFRSIAFGFIVKTLNPYCSCREPLRKGPYLAGALMPCIILGILPGIVSCINHSLIWLAVAVIMILGAGGDLMLVKMILNTPSGEDSLYLDHATKIGLVQFDKTV